MIDIAQHIRIFNINPDDDYVTKRTAAIKAIEETLKKTTTIDDIILLVNKLAMALDAPEKLDASILDMVEKALKKQSPAFVKEGQELQIAGCALIALLQYLDKINPATVSLTVSDVFAVAAWSSISFFGELSDKPKIEALKIEIGEQAKRIVNTDSFTTRKRSAIREMKDIPSSADPATLVINIKNEISPIIELLKKNAALDREEIDILWWKLNDWSNIGEAGYGSLKEIPGTIFKGIELAGLLRRLPNNAHYRMITLGINDESFDGHQILKAVEDHLAQITQYLKKYPIIEKAPKVFPLFNVLLNKTADVSFLDLKRPLKEWAGRALLEGTMIDLGRFLNDGK